MARYYFTTRYSASCHGRWHAYFDALCAIAKNMIAKERQRTTPMNLAYAYVVFSLQHDYLRDVAVHAEPRYGRRQRHASLRTKRVQPERQRAYRYAAQERRRESERQMPLAAHEARKSAEALPQRQYLRR